jgi:hypothetical protein
MRMSFALPREGLPRHQHLRQLVCDARPLRGCAPAGSRRARAHHGKWCGAKWRGFSSSRSGFPPTSSRNSSLFFGSIPFSRAPPRRPICPFETRMMFWYSRRLWLPAQTCSSPGTPISWMSHPGSMAFASSAPGASGRCSAAPDDERHTSKRRGAPGDGTACGAGPASPAPGAATARRHRTRHLHQRGAGGRRPGSAEGAGMRIESRTTWRRWRSRPRRRCSR